MTPITLFIGNIPTDTRIKELKKFVNSGASWWLRLRSGLRYRVIKVEILRNVDSLSWATEFHGLVTITPPSLVDPLIQRLHLKGFKGKPVVVRRYYERSGLNDGRYQDADTVLQQDRRTQVSIDFENEKSKILAYTDSE